MRWLIKMFLMFAVVLSPPVSAWADAMPSSLHGMLADSDVIVVGTIRDLDAETFTLEVEEVLHGGAKVGNRIKVTRFRNWGCGVRHAEYAVGQREVAILKLEADGTYKTNSTTGDAEFPLSGPDVSLGAEASYYKLTVQTVPVATFIDAVRDFHEIRAAGVSQADRSAYEKRSVLHAHLLKK